MASVACDGMESRRRRVCHHAQACISVGLIPYAALPRFHTASISAPNDPDLSSVAGGGAFYFV